MNLARALRLSKAPCLALVGAGGKTTALFRLARELPSPVLVTATTHLAVAQIQLADHHLIATRPAQLASLEKEILAGVTLVTGPVEGDRTQGVNKSVIRWLHAFSGDRSMPLLIEADGARQHPLKAPAGHEPAIPGFVELVAVLAGLSGLGQLLTAEHVHRPELFARLAQSGLGATITPEMLVRVLLHPGGGLKNIPERARRVVLLNQADTPELQAKAKWLSENLLPAYHAVIIAALEPRPLAEFPEPEVHAAFETVAGILLAAGESTRFGRPKQLLEYRGQPFVRLVAQTALAAGLSPVVIVIGAEADAVEAAVSDLPVVIVRNRAWRQGQSTSIRAGLQALPMQTGAAIFLLVDQPQVPTTVLRALRERHAADLAPVVAPLVNDRRANPVLFDRLTFPDLMQLTGDVGGRAIFHKHAPTYLPWQDESLLVDVDRPDDLAKLHNGG